jgi:hypothetical protein
MIKNLARTKLWGQIKKFQIIQEDLTFTCYIVRMDHYNEHEIESYIEKYIKDGVGQDVKVKFVYKGSIEPDKSGKYRIFKRVLT